MDENKLDRLGPINVCVIIYILELEDGKYYVGITYNLNMRYAQHLQGTGANWTALYKPKKILEVFYNPELNENQITYLTMKKYGIENVRGGNYCKIDMSDKTKQKLELILSEIN